MNDTPTRPVVRMQVDEILALVEMNLGRDEVERAMRWGALALSVNDDHEARGHADA
jgi:hypothetical protein